MSDIMEFANREEFRKWLYDHCLSDEGVWLLFGKADGPKTIKAGEALEEASSFFTIKWVYYRMDKRNVNSRVCICTDAVRMRN